MKHRHVICLGIESTAHTFGAGVVEENEEGDAATAPSFRILADTKDAYQAPLGSGIHPRDASRHHTTVGADVVKKALELAGVKVKEIDCIAYSAGPGLGPCLRVGAVIGRSLAAYYGTPLIPANHAIGHIELGKKLTGLRDPLVLLISGGHTALAAYKRPRWRIFGETLDLTLGQLLDQLGRFFGLASPAGQQMEKLALEGAAGKEGGLMELPYTVKGNDVSYSGLLSAAKALVAEGKSREAISYAVQEYAFSMLIEATERALAFTDNQELLVTGGVAANRRLSSMLELMCTARGVKLGVIPRQYAGDCGAQIGAAGLQFFRAAAVVPPEKAFVRQSWRIDQVDLQQLARGGSKR